jgi:7,8-dihydropterin-6-yl-methyl-4-(beta-D-ribofuranosyl)aminobenzene 5'-phosphate synthase
MKITVLAENTACEGFACEHGLSLFVETKGKKLLFDFGQTEAFAENAEKLGIDLSEADVAVLSHGHYDHSGGLERFLQLNKTAPVYISRYAFRPHFNADGKDIGVAAELRGIDRLILTQDRMDLGGDMTLLSCNDLGRPYPTDAYGLKEYDRPDEFLHEQYLLVEENGKRIVLSGCSHKGILNIAGWLQPDVLIGGFHFMKLDPETDREILKDAAEKLLQTGAVYYTGHCTGAAQYDYLKTIMGDRLQALTTGMFMDI